MSRKFRYIPKVPRPSKSAIRAHLDFLNFGNQDMQQYTCPECGHVGASSIDLSIPPLCDKCDYSVIMEKSHNGKIQEPVKNENITGINGN